MRIVFMGTPQIAEECLAELLARDMQVVGVYTRPDKPVGRKQVVTPPPVKVLALEKEIPVFQPRNMRALETAQEFAALKPDVAVVVAYGCILPPAILAAPTHGCINLHVSLLPHYRGAAPIQWAVINGDAKTGVTVMKIDEGLDTGPVLAQEEIAIGPNDTAGDVFERAGATGARLLADTITQIEKGAVSARSQQGEASHARMLSKDMARLDFSRTAAELHNLVRGCNPWPLAWFEHGNKRIKVEATRLVNSAEGQPGEIVNTNPLVVSCGAGALELRQVVPQGARSMKGAEWAAGRRFTAGDTLCSDSI